MKTRLAQTIMALGLPLLASLPSEGWAVVRGEAAYGPAYSAVISLEACSAVVIHPKAFLTAAHCASDLYRGENKVYFSTRRAEGRVSVKSVYVAEGYETEKWGSTTIKANGDFALVVLSEPIENAEVLSHIPKIIDESALAPNQTLTAVGFGLHKLPSSIHVGDDENYSRRKAIYRLQEKRFSVDFLKALQPGVGVCGGDSGGALLRVSADGKSSELVATLTAVGGTCGDKNHYDYAESVSSHLDWIKQNLQKEGLSLD